MLLPSITHFASSHETLSAAEATLAKRKAARIFARSVDRYKYLRDLPRQPLRSSAVGRALELAVLLKSLLSRPRQRWCEL